MTIVLDSAGVNFGGRPSIGYGDESGPPGILRRDAVLWLDAKYSVADRPGAINQGTGGSALDAKYGSVLGAYVYDGAAVLPKIVSNWLTIPDAASLDVTGDLELVARVRPTTYGTGAASIITKWAAGQISYGLRFNASGQLSFSGSASGLGAVEVAVAATGAPPYSLGTTFWVKVTFTASTGGVLFYWASDQTAEPSSWTQIGIGVSIAATSLFAGTSPVIVGGRGDISLPFDGKIYRALVRDGIGGTTVLDVDLSSVADYATSFTAATGQTVTVNSTSADTNDPLFLPHTGENYVHLPGIAGNYLSVPHEAAFVITGDIEIVARIALPDWTPSTLGTIASRDAAGVNRSWRFGMTTTGTLQFIYSPDGAAGTYVTADSTVAVPFADGAWGWVKVTLDADNGAAEKTTRFYTAADSATEPTSWTQLGADVTTAGVATIFGGTAPVELGSYGAGLSVLQVMLGKRLILRNGIDGSTVLDVNTLTNVTSSSATSFTATTGQTVTVNRATSGRKTALVTRPIWLFGTDDYLEVADNALLDFADTDSFTVMGVARSWSTFGTGDVLLAKKAALTNTTAGYSLGAGTTAAQQAFDVGDGVAGAESVSGSRTSGTLYGIFGVRDRTGDTITIYLNNTAGTPVTDATTATSANAEVFRVGRLSGAGTEYFDGEIVAVAVWRRVLTTDEIAQINQYYGTA